MKIVTLYMFLKQKIPKSDWLSTALISAFQDSLVGQYASCLYNWTVRAITRPLKWLFFSLLAKKIRNFLCFNLKKSNRTSCRPIRSVIILVIKQIGLPLRGRLILLIPSMITERIGLHSVLSQLLIESQQSPRSLPDF